MNLLLFGMTVLLAEGLAALVAFVGLQARVDAPVNHEVGVRAEGLVACVRLLVEDEARAAVEGLGAVAARVACRRGGSSRAR